jgi:hypothetical protein
MNATIDVILLESLRRIELDCRKCEEDQDPKTIKVQEYPTMEFLNNDYLP